MAKNVKLIPRELRDISFPEARFLSQEEQIRYEEFCKSFGEKARNSLNIKEKGSNLFKVLFLNQNGIKTATLPELDLIAETEPEFLRRTYEDAPAVALRSAGDSYPPNDSLAKSLAKLIKKKSFPHTIIIEGLKIKEDTNSDYGLSFEKGENYKIIEAPDFDHANNQKKFKRINPDYTIDFDNNSTRILYTKDNGLSRLYLGRKLYANSYYKSLAYSDDYGRVVVVSGEATPKNFDDYLGSLKRIKDEEITKINQRYIQAENILRGK